MLDEKVTKLRIPHSVQESLSYSRTRSLWKCQSRECCALGATISFPTVNPSELASGRLLNLGGAPGHLSFEMSCSFTVQMLAQRDFLKKVTRIKAYKNVFQLLTKELDAGASMAKNCCPLSSSSSGRLQQEPSMAKNCWSSSSSSAGRLRQEPSITKNCCTSSSKFGCSKWKSRAQVAESCSKSAGSSASPTPPFRRVRLR